MRTYKKELPKGVKKVFAKDRGVKVKILNTLYLKNKKAKETK